MLETVKICPKYSFGSVENCCKSILEILKIGFNGLKLFNIFFQHKTLEIVKICSKYSFVSV